MAIRKGINSCKLVCKDVVTGSRDVTKSSLAHQNNVPTHPESDFCYYGFMVNLKDYFTGTDLSSLAIPSNISYGEAIFTRGAVVVISQSTTAVEAWAGGLDGTIKEGAGSKRRVQLWLEEGNLRSHCTGNPKNHDIFCKHCVAVALFVRNS